MCIYRCAYIYKCSLSIHAHIYIYIYIYIHTCESAKRAGRFVDSDPNRVPGLHVNIPYNIYMRINRLCI